METVHARRCHWLATSAGFTAKAAAAHSTSKRRWAHEDQSWHSKGSGYNWTEIFFYLKESYHFSSLAPFRWFFSPYDNKLFLTSPNIEKVKNVEMKGKIESKTLKTKWNFQLELLRIENEYSNAVAVITKQLLTIQTFQIQASDIWSTKFRICKSLNTTCKFF